MKSASDQRQASLPEVIDGFEIETSGSQNTGQAKGREENQDPTSEKNQEEFTLQKLLDGFFEEEYGSPSPSPPSDTAVLYCRVSTDDQAKDGHSIPVQKKKTREVAQNRDLNPVYGPIIDDGETATNFEREGLKRIGKLALNGKISHIIVTKFDRFARRSAQGLALLYALKEVAGVSLVTEKNGEVGLEGPEMMHTMLSLHMAEEENRARTKSSQRVLIDQFRSGNYRTFHETAPYGYRLPDDEESPVPVEDELDVVKRLFEVFVEANDYSPYQETLDRVDSAPDEMDSQKLKDILEDSIYIGVPSGKTSNYSHYDRDEVVFYDSNLKAVPREIYLEAQDKIWGMKSKSSKRGEKQDEQLFGQYRAKDILEFVETFVAYCSDCEESMRRNGTKQRGGETVQVYKCGSCNTQRRTPTAEEERELNARRTDGGIQFDS